MAAGDGEVIGISFGGDSTQVVDELKRIKRVASNEGREMAKNLGSAFNTAEKAADRASTSMRNKLSRAFDAARTGAGAALNAANALAAGVLAAGAAYKALGDHVFGTVDQMNTFAQASGLSLDTINGLRRAASDANKDLAEIFPKDLSKRMLETAAGTGEAIIGFQALGVEVTKADGSLRSVDEVLFETIDQLAKVEDPAARSALAVKALGEEGKNMLSAFDSSDGLKRAVENAREFGIAAGPAAVEASNAWWKATSNVTTAFEHLGQSVIDRIGPGITDWVNRFSLGLIQVTEFVSALTSGTHGVESAWEAATEKSMLFWKMNIAQAPESEAMLDGQHAKLETISVDYANLLNNSEAYAKALRGKLGPAIDDSAAKLKALTEDAQLVTEDISAAFQTAADKISADMARVKEDTKRTLNQIRDAALLAFDFIRQISDFALERQIESSRAQLDNLRESGRFTEEELETIEALHREKLIEGFRRNQALQIAAATIESIRAGVSLVPGFAFLGPAAPAAAAAAAATMLGISIASIRAQEPPTFPTGGVVMPLPMRGADRVDHQVVGAQAGEGIASLRAMQDSSFRAALQAANEGQRMQGPSATTMRLVVSYDRSARTLRVTPGPRRSIGKRDPRRR